MFLAAALTIPAAVPVAASESTADKEETVYTVTTTNTDSVKYYLVNTSGTILKNKTNAKDADDYKFYVSGKTINEVVLED